MITVVNSIPVETILWYNLVELFSNSNFRSVLFTIRYSLSVIDHYSHRVLSLFLQWMNLKPARIKSNPYQVCFQAEV